MAIGKAVAISVRRFISIPLRWIERYVSAAPGASREQAMKKQSRLPVMIATLLVAGVTTAQAEAIRQIDAASEEVRAAMASSDSPNLSPAAQASLRTLQQALDQGKNINDSLNSQIKALEDERAKLQQAQTVLTSGLVGAMVTAIVAILGAFVTSRNSRPDRDLKRLAVIEKVRELKAANVKLPPDLARADGS
jgi:predicted PurR-regulated permease PerM